MGISARSRTVLSQVVTLHYRTCGPVGSSLVSQTRELPCSSATIRNIMMRLESTGHLSQPHVSAGRLPTDLGYRTYVNDIQLVAKSLQEQERVHLDRTIQQAPNTSMALKQVADYVHERTNLVTFSLPFRHLGFRLGHLHLERINRSRLLALWVARGGQTFQSFLDIPEHELGQPQLEKTGNYFNNAFRDKSLRDIQRSLSQQYGRQGGNWDTLLTGAARVAQSMMTAACAHETINFTGVSKILEMPEFQDLTQVRTICRILEHQTQIQKLIERLIEAENEWVCFFIGAEICDPEWDSLAVVLGKFRSSDDWAGCVGALGPKRLPYLNSLQILRYAQERMRTVNY